MHDSDGYKYLKLKIGPLLIIMTINCLLIMGVNRSKTTKTTGDVAKDTNCKAEQP